MDGYDIIEKINSTLPNNGKLVESFLSMLNKKCNEDNSNC
jgi:hypothetical protein